MKIKIKLLFFILIGSFVFNLSILAIDLTPPDFSTYNSTSEIKQTWDDFTPIQCQETKLKIVDLINMFTNLNNNFNQIKNDSNMDLKEKKEKLYQLYLKIRNIRYNLIHYLNLFELYRCDSNTKIEINGQLYNFMTKVSEIRESYLELLKKIRLFIFSLLNTNSEFADV